ncbi:MAG: transmission trait enhancer LetE [Gammaproteobacteria bacterium]|nr:transmission trait enhancer LetE [Gammaproteobacteria bacterium]
MDDSLALLPDIKLRFNINHPCIEEAYWYGYECAAANITEDVNPFESGSTESEHWMEGWWAGFYGETPTLAHPLEVEHQQSQIQASANDHMFHDHLETFLVKFLEISGVLVLSAIVGYQLMELVA